MDAIEHTSSTSSDTASSATTDGTSTAAYDMPYRFGRRPSARATFPFTERQFGRLLIVRGRVQDAPSAEDQLAA
jgi:hypothetical protein